MTANEMYQYGYEAGLADATDGDAMSVDVAEDGADYAAGYVAGYESVVAALVTK